MSLKRSMLLALSLALVAGVVLIGGCAGTETAAPEPEKVAQIIEDVSPQEAYTLIQENQGNPDFVILDVRTPEEFADGHIEDAINIDFYSETFRDELDRLDKSQTYLIYCRSGARSGKSLQIMADLDFKEAYNVLGGILAWREEGLPTTQ